jgi:hypothetical protein
VLRLRQLRQQGDPFHAFHVSHGFTLFAPSLTVGVLLWGVIAYAMAVGDQFFNKLERLFCVEGGTPMAFG